jgi:hypothetical protein
MQIWVYKWDIKSIDQSEGIKIQLLRNRDAERQEMKFGGPNQQVDYRSEFKASYRDCGCSCSENIDPSQNFF